jgi:hypothetical protein
MQVDIKKKSNALIIGNGRSRLVFDLNQLQQLFTTYGCNALYRDFMPDYLISHDFGIADEIVQNKAHYKTKFYTQHGTKMDNRHSRGEPINFVIQDKWMGDSGTGALRLACNNGHKTIYMIGFDYTTQNKYIDNVYAGSTHYQPGPINNGGQFMLTQWETRLRYLCRTYSNTQIIRVNGNDYIPVCKEQNFKNISIKEFVEKINELQNG